MFPPLSSPVGTIASLLTHHQQEFVAAPALAPPEANVDEVLLAQYRNEMEAAAQQPLPNEEDDDDL